MEDGYGTRAVARKKRIGMDREEVRERGRYSLYLYSHAQKSVPHIQPHVLKYPRIQFVPAITPSPQSPIDLSLDARAVHLSKGNLVHSNSNRKFINLTVKHSYPIAFNKSTPQPQQSPSMNSFLILIRIDRSRLDKCELGNLSFCHVEINTIKRRSRGRRALLQR